MNFETRLITKEEKAKLDIPDTNIAIQQWGCKENIEYETVDGRKFKGDAFIFHLLVPESFIPNGDLVLKTPDGKVGERIYFKLMVGTYPKYFDFKVDEIFPRYLGKMCNNQHVVEMIAPYKIEDIGEMSRVRKAIRAGDTHLSFSIV